MKFSTKFSKWRFAKNFCSTFCHCNNECLKNMKINDFELNDFRRIFSCVKTIAKKFRQNFKSTFRKRFLIDFLQNMTMWNLKNMFKIFNKILKMTRRTRFVVDTLYTMSIFYEKTKKRFEKTILWHAITQSNYYFVNKTHERRSTIIKRSIIIIKIFHLFLTRSTKKCFKND